MTFVDLFGQPPPDPQPKKRRATPANGYAARPGTGPAGKQCRDCAHICRRDFGSKYLKCALTRAKWTRGPGSDIRARAAACAYFEERAND